MDPRGLPVRLATCAALPEPDPDEGPLLAALRAAGLDASLAAWDDPGARWQGGLTVLRSTWNYHLRLDDFRAWLTTAAAAGTVLNPPPLVAWNVHKRYLADLETDGFPVTPTVHLARGAAGVRLADVLADRGWRDAVVKPAVSAGSNRTIRATAPDLAAAEAHLADLLVDRDAMIQPYLRSVEGHGERAVVWLDGEVTHAVRKAPRFAGADEAVSAALRPAPDERELARALVARAAARVGLAPDAPLYGRADLARDERGRALVMELELVEPSLFLEQHPPARTRLVAAIARRAAAHARG